MPVWFEATETINCSMETATSKLGDVGNYIQSVVSLMPGISKAELLETSQDMVKIKTNEGTMIRSHISRAEAANTITVEFDETYEAGSMMVTKSHHKHVFTGEGEQLAHQLSIGNVSASGFMGWLYRTFGAGNIGKAIMAATKAHLES